MCHVLLSIVLLAILAATLINLLALLENILFWQLSDWWDEHVCGPRDRRCDGAS